MKTIMKTILVSIASLSLMFSVNAGELSVSGTAKATYNASSGVQTDNGIGVTNELNFTASGEMDNGYTWSYSMELDPSTTGSATVSTSLVVRSPPTPPTSLEKASRVASKSRAATKTTS